MTYELWFADKSPIRTTNEYIHYTSTYAREAILEWALFSHAHKYIGWEKKVNADNPKVQ